MVHLIVGYGEVGQALHKIFPDALWCDRKGGTWNKQKVDVIHISIPYKSDPQFKEAVNSYKEYSPLIIVHSTTPFGLCDELEVVHSPIRGVHPNLEGGIRTFVKYFGGKNADKAAKIFSDLGIKTKVYPEAKTTEAIKLWDTTQYGMLIVMSKGIYKWCEENKVDFKEVYQDANIDYNEGYLRLGRPDVVRPFLKYIPGPIGGHCIIPNAKLLGIDLEIPEELK